MPDNNTSAMVRFERPWSNYIPGDVATFPLDVARTLVGNRVAHAVQVQQPPRPPPKPDAPAADIKTPQRQPTGIVRK
ncbi:MAG: hypothetical protein WBZ37_29545 [Mycobacterium sp.]